MERENSFGYFQSNGSEFVVIEQETPRALVNYSWNKRFISGVSQHGGGDGVYKERAMQYIDPRGRNLMVKNGHRYFYIHDCENGKVWSPGWHPVQEELDAFKCIHGLGYSKFESSKSGIETNMRLFVPEKEACEIWTITIKNTNNSPKTLKFYTFVDWLLQGYSIYCDYFACLSAEYYEDMNAIHAKNRAIERPHDFFDGFMASDIKPSGFDSSRKQFLGSFGHVKSPKVVMKGSCTNSIASCEYMVGVLEHTLELQANESVTFNVLIGATNGADDIRKTTKALFDNPETIENEFTALKERNSTSS